MKEGFRQSMAWLHTWTGLVVGWVLFFVFVTGTVGYFYVEIDRWMRPELPLSVGKAVAAGDFAEKAQAYLHRHAAGAERWVITLPTEREPAGAIRWTDAPGPGGARQSHDRAYNPVAGDFVKTAQPRQTRGAFGLYRMHHSLFYLPQLTAQRIVGACSMLMLVALVTGVIAHKKIFTDFFTFRPARGQRSWLDLHNLMGVLALPFFVMIVVSGVVFYTGKYMPSTVQALYGDGGLRASEMEAYPRPAWPEPAHRTAPMLPFAHFLAEADRRWGAGKAGYLDIRWPGDANAWVALRGSGAGTVLRGTGERLYFDAVSGALILVDTKEASAPRRIESVLYGLHEGVFAGWVLRWLYFGSSLMGCAMIATGLVLWTVKRRTRQARAARPGFGFRLLECLNIGTIVGLMVAIAAFFWANRLLPADMAGRAEWEIHVMFLAWGAMLSWAALRPPGRAWAEELWLAAAGYGLLPVLNALTTDRHLGVTLPAGDWVLAGFDLAVLAMGLLFTVAAARVQRRWAAPTGVHAARAPVEVVP